MCVLFPRRRHRTPASSFIYIHTHARAHDARVDGRAGGRAGRQAYTCTHTYSQTRVYPYQCKSHPAATLTPRHSYTNEHGRAWTTKSTHTHHAACHLVCPAVAASVPFLLDAVPVRLAFKSVLKSQRPSPSRIHMFSGCRRLKKKQ